MSRAETAETCTKQIYEYCPIHPVDCPSCRNAPVCQMRETMQAHPDQIKRCLLYRRRV